MNGDEIAAHPYYQALKAARLSPPPRSSAWQPFWTRVLGDVTRLAAELDGARQDVANHGVRVTELTDALHEARQPPPTDPAGAARPLTLSAQEALALALTRPRSELDDYVLYPGECSREVIDELLDHDLVVVESHENLDDNVEDFYWYLGAATATLTRQAIPSEPNP